MRYEGFIIENYRAIVKQLEISLHEHSLVPLVGINECGKTTVLEALFCFDFINDKEYESRHLVDIKNLYQTKEGTPSVTAKIKITNKQLQDFITDYNQTIEESSIKEDDSLEFALEEEFEELLIDAKELASNGIIQIKRDIDSLHYSMPLVKNVSQKTQHYFAHKIVSRAPYMLYNDDFTDRPPSKIEIPEEKSQKISGWLAIYERVFRTTSSDYSLFSLTKEKDIRRRKSILADVTDHLNRSLSNSWKTFSLDSKTTAVSLKLDLRPMENKPNINELIIEVVEAVNNRDRYFDIVDRSKGFLWFYNFIMKVQFNPKIIGNPKDTLFLLDEPGSYLHSAAQEKLCSKLKDISQKSGIVIYCTHSHHLLNPNVIPFGSILIIEKNKQKQINVTPLPTYKTSGTKILALQPVHEALQVSGFDFIPQNRKVICVEGIYDKCVIELFVSLEDDVVVLAGTNASSIVKNIQFLDAYGHKYIGLWDNDNEGRKHRTNALRSFGKIYEARFLLLPSFNRQKMTMNNMFSKIDIGEIRTSLNLNNNATYESIIHDLYYSNPKTQKKILKSLDNSESQNNFSVLSEMLKKAFQEW